MGHTDLGKNDVGVWVLDHGRHAGGVDGEERGLFEFCGCVDSGFVGD